MPNGLSSKLAPGAVLQEFAYSQQDFDTIRAIVGERTGIHLSDAKRQLVYSRLARRLRSLGLESFSQYCALLRDGEEIGECINAITTNVTAFFREPHHFEFLAGTALPELLKRNACNRKLRLWSAGCSSGEEPYSIAMTVLETPPGSEPWDVRILASDLDSSMVEHARAGVYPLERVQAGVSPARLRRWFLRGTGVRQGFASARPALRDPIAFAQLNLMDPWPVRGPFDVIFCRNVVIYFTPETKRALFGRFAEILRPEGFLFIGHSETLHGMSEEFEPIGRNVYRRLP